MTTPTIQERFVDELREAAKALAGKQGLNNDTVESVAESIATWVSKNYGGERVYVHVISKEKLAQAVRKEFNGKNRVELCRKYEISRSRFYEVIGTRSVN